MAAPNLSAEQQETLAAALRRGEPRAFDDLYAAMHSSIYSFAARLLDDSEEAKDVTQDVFLAAYRDLPQHRGALRVEPWLFKVTMNACYDRLRARARRADTPLDEVAVLVDHRDGYDQAAMVAAVEAALRDMSPRYRAALILHDVQGLNRRELSEAMDVTWGTAGVLLFRARAAFKKRLSTLLPAGGGVAALALLPQLPVPSSLQAPPAFGAPALAAPLAAPLAAAPAAMPAAAPLLGLANIGGVLGTKVAIVAAGVLALASGLAIQQTADQQGVPYGGGAPVQAQTAQRGGDPHPLQSHWPGGVPQHLQQLQAGATGDAPGAGPAREAAGDIVREQDGAVVSGESAGTATQQAGGGAGDGSASDGSTSDGSAADGASGTADSSATDTGLKTSSTERAIRD